jgi:putative transcriptional regulator
MTWPAILAPVLAQTPLSQKDLAPGLFLVARRDLPDPNFQDSVILLIQYSRTGAMGLIINQPTKVTLPRLLPNLPKLIGRNDPVYRGGPVNPEGVLALLRSKTRIDDTTRVIDEIHMISSRKLLEDSFAAGAGSDTLRLFLGYSGWGPAQLDNEVDAGVWHIFRADADSVFAPDPAALYPRLIRRTELRIAGLRPFHP